MLLDTFCCTDEMAYKEIERCPTGEDKEISSVDFSGLFRDIQGYTDSGVQEERTSDAIVYMPMESLTDKPKIGSVIEYEGDLFRVETVTRMKDYSQDCCVVIGYKLALKTKCLDCV